MDVIKQQSFKSKSSARTYLATVYANGESYCECPAWKFKRPGRERTCDHIAQLTTVVPPPPEPPPAAPAALFPTAPAPTRAPLDPMLASAMTGRQTFADYANDAWALEPKFDGHRLVIEVRPDGITGWPRSAGATGIRKLPPHILAALRHLPHGCYDGELMAPTGKAWDVVRLDLSDQLFLVLFDVVELLGQRLIDKPYSERRAALTLAIHHLPAAQTAVHLTLSLPVSWAAVEAIWASGGEGAILKRRDAPYRPGYRTEAWVKVVPTRTATLTITGFKPGSFGPYAVTVLKHDDGTVTQIKTKDFETIARIAASPEAWIGRRLVISYRERTKGGAFRHPMWSAEWDHEAGDAE